MKNKLILALVAVLFLGINHVIAQKIGHFDIQYVLPQLPEYKIAEEEMKTYQEQLSKEFEDKKVSFEEKAKVFQAESQNPNSTLTIAQIKEKQTELEQLQGELQNYEQIAVQKFQEKQAKLLEPMYDKIQTALDAVAKEGSYIYVLRKEAILYDLPENDLSNAVLKKLGVTPK